MTAIEQNRVINALQRSGLLKFNTKILIPILFLLLLGLQSTYQTQEALAIDKGAIAEDNTFEGAVGKYVFDELLSSFCVNRSTGQTYDNGELYSTRQLLNLLTEIHQIKLLNKTIITKIVEWIFDQRNNESTEVIYWWDLDERQFPLLLAAKSFVFLHFFVE